MKYPDKLFYTIGEVSRITQLKPYVLRYWESEFTGVLKPERDPVGKRRYRKRDIEVIETIKTLLYKEKYTIEGAKRTLKAGRRVRKETFEKKESDFSFIKDCLVEMLEMLSNPSPSCSLKR